MAMTIHIDNPEIEHFFVHELHSDIKRFSDFILSNLKKYKNQNDLVYEKLDIDKNSYKLDFGELEDIDEEANPFKDVDDVVSYAKELREKAWR
jgi:Xaa-Pro aminopeptidase